MTDQVHLTIPASAEYAMVARLTAAGVASRLGLTYDEVEDLRVVVAEMCRLLLGTSTGDAANGTLTLTYSVDGTELAIEGSADGERTPLEGDEGDLSVSLIEALTDSYALESNSGRPHVRVVKRLSA
ncbi:MAG TPA: ATP-binding protein [Acidimicrobiia bacterium]|nr:ATP-binding protein [Acidimicrobiia bacterium]